MEEIRQAILQIADVHEKISQLLTAHSHKVGSATFSMLEDSDSVVEYTRQIGSQTNFSNDELGLVLGVRTSLVRHLSEVEQSLYEEIGEKDYNQLISLIDDARTSFNYILDHLKAT